MMHDPPIREEPTSCAAHQKSDMVPKGYPGDDRVDELGHLGFRQNALTNQPRSNVRRAHTTTRYRPAAADRVSEHARQISNWLRPRTVFCGGLLPHHHGHWSRIQDALPF